MRQQGTSEKKRKKNTENVSISNLTNTDINTVNDNNMGSFLYFSVLIMYFFLFSWCSTMVVDYFISYQIHRAHSHPERWLHDGNHVL